MNPWTNLLKPEAEARVRAEIGSISGVAIQRLTATPPVNINTLGLLNVVIRMTGWSPSLNEVTMLWRGTVYQDDDAGKQACKLIELFGDRLNLQRERLTEGMALGRAAPFEVGGMDGSAKDTEAGHILIDSALASMIEARRPGEVLREAGDAVFDLHQEDQGERDGTETRYEGRAIDDDGRDAGARVLHGRELRQEIELANGIMFDGRILRFDADPPETVLAAAVGRPLSDLVDAHPLLAGRRIVSATSLAGRMRIRIEADLRPVSDLTTEHGQEKAA